VFRQVLDRVQPPVAQPTRQYADRLNAGALELLRIAAQGAGKRTPLAARDVCPLLVAALPEPICDELAQQPAEFHGVMLRRPERSAAARAGRLIADTAPGQLIARVARAPKLAWNVYIRRSLGHRDYEINPYRVYRWLREREPVRRDPMAPVWVVTNYEHTLTALRDSRFSKDPFVYERLPRGAREQLGMSEGAGARSSVENISMLFLDPPDHTRVRSIFTRAFTPRTLESLRPRIAEICEEQIAAIAARSDHTMELMRDLAAPLPVMVIAELLGFPREDYGPLKKWSDDMTEALGFLPSEDAKLRAARARDEMRDYFFDRIVPQRRREPNGSLLSGLLDLEARGEGLNEDELFSNAVLLLAAGHETTTNLIGNGLLALLRHPAQRRDLEDHPELIGDAVEEMLRYDSPVQWISRVAGEDFQFGGMQLKRGDLVLAALGAANRDPAVFADPDALNIRRADNRHLSFGSGPHFCLGAALARMEAQIAISALLQRFPGMQLARQKIRWRKGITFRGVHELVLKI
jgi:cytochrome P450